MSKSRSRRWLPWLAVFFFLALLAFFGSSVQAAPLLQLTPFFTPTPGQDGRILYIVQPNDTLWRISAITGVPLDQLRALNKLPGDIVKAGDVLLIGLGGPSVSQSTPVFGSTAQPVQPTATAQPGSGNICVMLYLDSNGDGMRQTSEPWILGGQINVTDQLKRVSKTAPTENVLDAYGDPKHLCFEDLPEGDYIVTVAIPQGYNATMSLTKTFKLLAGDQTYLSFGAQLNAEKTSEQALAPVQPGRSPLLAVVGGALLLAALGLGGYALVMVRRR